MQFKGKTVFISGIGGIGTSALAQYIQSCGGFVLGSDVVSSTITTMLEAQDITVILKQDEANIGSHIDIHIYSAALPKDNVERIAVKNFGIPSYSYPEMLGLISREHITYGVSGTNGKTTTTAMLGSILSLSEMNPNIIVGSIVNQWGSNFRKGNTTHLLVEACEYKRHFHEFDLESLIITNIELDHLDYYKDLADISDSFQTLIDKINQSGYIFINYDDENCKQLNMGNHQYVTYGFCHQADYHIDRRNIHKGRQQFDVFYKGIKLDDFEIMVPGVFNMYNALAAIAFAHQYNIPLSIIKQGLSQFTGTWRRAEYIGLYGDHVIFSDYGHHPDAITKTLEAFKELYPDVLIHLIFQPHQHNRTKELFDTFVQSMVLADIVTLMPIYDVVGREESQDQDVSSEDLVKALEAYNKIAIIVDNIREIKNRIDHVSEKSVIIFMGAGDIDMYARELLKN